MKNESQYGLLLLQRYLYEHTDDQHPASVADILAFWLEHGIQAGRKSVYSASSELHLKCGSCGSTITTDTDTVLTEANRQIYAHEHPKQPAYAPSAEVIRLSNAINRGLEQPDSPEAVMALILQGAAARYDCCPEPISEYENFDHLPKADWNHFWRVVSYITITQEHIITVQFTDQAGKDE